MLKKNDLEVGKARFSNPTAFVATANTDSGSTPLAWLLIIQTLFAEIENLALFTIEVPNTLLGMR